MAFIALLWRLVRRRWVRQMLLWLVVRLLRLFGWRRAVKLAFRERRHWRTLAVGAWRAAVGLLRVGRAAFILLGWLRPRVWRPLRQGTTYALRRSTVAPAPRRLRAGDEQSVLRLSPTLRAKWAPRVARRRDEVRRSLLAAVGVDPYWRPARKPRAGDARAIGPKNRPELGDRLPELRDRLPELRDRLPKLRDRLSP